MDAAARDLLEQAEQAYRRSVRDPCADGDVPALVARARDAGAAEALVVALRAQAWCARHSLAAREARGLLDEAVRVARAHDLVQRLREVLATRAAVQQELGRTAAAQRDLDEARRLGASSDADWQQAVLLHNSGRLSEAAQRYRALLARPGLEEIKVKAGNNLALVESHQGHHRAALARLDALVPQAERLGPALHAVVLDSRAWVSVQGGQLVRGLRLLDEAAAAHVRAGLPLGEHYLEHADALLDLRLLPEARAMTVLAAGEFDRQGLGLLAAEARLREARLALLSGDHEQAADAGASAAAQFRRQRRTSWALVAQVVELEARARLGDTDPRACSTLRRAGAVLQRTGLVSAAAGAYLAAGRRDARAGRRAAALDSLGRASALTAGGPALLRIEGRIAAAIGAELSGRSDEVVRHCRAGLADLSRHRAALPSVELRARASGHGVELGLLGLAALLPDASPGRVLRWLERTRAAAHLVNEVPTTEGVEDALSQLRTVHEELSAARSDGTPPAALLAQQSSLEARIRRATWVQEAPGRREDGAVSLRALREDLAGTTLVELGTSRGRLFAVVLTPRRARLVHLAQVAQVELEVRKLLLAVRRLASGAPAAAVRAHVAGAAQARSHLVEQLLAPLELPSGSPVVVVPTARTWALPWSALHDGPVSVAPSAATWTRSARAAPTDGRRVVLVAGPDLPGAVTEVQALAALHGDARVLLPPHSTVEAVVAQLAQADLAHLACHGTLRADNPVFSSFRLSGGALTLHELGAQRRAPHRVVLSACDSGTGTALAGDELLGVVGALLARGTAGVLASCVPVPDTAVVPLMCAVHARLRRGDTLAEALHASRSVLDPQDPLQLAASYAFAACGAA